MVAAMGMGIVVVFVIAMVVVVVVVMVVVVVAIVAFAVFMNAFSFRFPFSVSSVRTLSLSCVSVRCINFWICGKCLSLEAFFDQGVRALVERCPLQSGRHSISFERILCRQMAQDWCACACANAEAHLQLYERAQSTPHNIFGFTHTFQNTHDTLHPSESASSPQAQSSLSNRHEQGDHSVSSAFVCGRFLGDRC